MSAGVILDDDFVMRQLTLPAGMQALAPPPSIDVRSRIDATIDRCRTLFSQHRGLDYRDDSSPEARMLLRGLEIVGATLGFESALDLYERVIGSDWLAHVSLEKEKRYRDHITHPVRVTAIGRWLLDREQRHLLKKMAEHYESATRTYVAEQHIDLCGMEWTAIVEYAWLACGLLHDSAYPFEYHLRAGEHLKGSDALRLIAARPESFQRRGAAREALDYLARSWLQGQRLGISERLSRLPQDEFKNSHALLGALLHTVAKANPLHSLSGLVRQLAARAILTHHDTDDRAILSDPLAHLLFVADNLQFWGRPFMHRSAIPAGGHALRALVECRSVELEPRGEGYLARLVMNIEAGDMAILKTVYNWKLEKFQEPNRRLETLLAARDGLPRIELSLEECVCPPEFRTFMGS